MLSTRPSAWQDACDPFWADEHISKGMLAAHLDPSTDAASRRPESIDRTIAWLEKAAFALVSGGARRLLDLGCGPGLYATRLARSGYDVVGVDISSRSLEYARDAARHDALEIEYRLLDYRALDYDGRFDAAFMIWCDFGALSPGDRSIVLSNIARALRPGGVFAFDVAGEGLGKKASECRDWSVLDSGFWSPRPHLALERTLVYPEDRVQLRDHTVVYLETGEVRRYPIRDTWFGEDDLRAELGAANFDLVSVDRDVVENDDDVLFAVARKR